jgi:hypothetical protein
MGIGPGKATAMRRLWLNAAIVAAGYALMPLTSARADHAGRALANHGNVSGAVRDIASRIAAGNDHQGLPYLVIDKVEARAFLFDGAGRMLVDTPVLLGLAIGDDAVPGIGERPLSAIRPAERTTPAGRFLAALGHNLAGKEVLWVDYDNAISLHPVVTDNPAENRLERLASRSAKDKRISYGCINVPQRFFRDMVSPLFREHGGMVYVLPETRPAALLPGEQEGRQSAPETAIIADN